jgi:hypothetical protein
MMTIYIYAIFVLMMMLTGIIIIVGYFLFNGIISVPWVRTPRKLTDEMLKLANLKSGERVVDFGSGDGSIVIEAVKNFGAVGYGIERLSLLVWWSRWLASRNGVSDRTTFVRGNMFKQAPPEADVITSYLFSDVNIKLEPMLIEHYPSGTRVVARVFSFPGLKHIRSLNVGSDTIHLYEIP